MQHRAGARLADAAFRDALLSESVLSKHTGAYTAVRCVEWMWNALYGAAPPGPQATVADGIGVQSPGALTLPLIREHVDEVLLVGEDDIELAILTLLEIENIPLKCADLHRVSRPFLGDHVQEN